MQPFHQRSYFSVQRLHLNLGWIYQKTEMSYLLLLWTGDGSEPRKSGLLDCLQRLSAHRLFCQVRLKHNMESLLTHEHKLTLPIISTPLTMMTLCHDIFIVHHPSETHQKPDVNLVRCPSPEFPPLIWPGLCDTVRIWSSGTAGP